MSCRVYGLNIKIRARVSLRCSHYVLVMFARVIFHCDFHLTACLTGMLYLLFMFV